MSVIMPKHYDALKELNEQYGDIKELDEKYFNLAEEMQLKNIPKTNDNLVDNDDRFWYLATPYSKFPGGMGQAYLDACEMLAFLLKNNIFTYCPISHNHTAARWVGSTEHAFWLPLDFRYIEMSRGLIVCKMAGWDTSYGIGKELEWAKQLGKPIIYTNFLEIPVL